ncbi:UNVERIFIED_CONTAM: hypothetical protein FKN15_009531 [Acipenser sinensis]
MSASYRLHQPCRAAQEHQRFSERPPIPRASQLPLLHPGTRERCQRATGFTSPAELLRNTEASYRLHQPCRAAQEHRRFSERPLIPRASQLPLLHPGTRERCQRANGFTSPAELLRNTEGSVSVLRSHERASFLFYTQELESDVSELPASRVSARAH